MPELATIPLTIGRTVSLATLWEIDRVDGTSFYYTDHDRPIVWADPGNLNIWREYLPISGVGASATEAGSTLEPSDRELVGHIVASEITHDDLRSGKYSLARVTERVVDPRFPFAGAISTKVWIIVEEKYDGVQWVMGVESVSSYLKQRVGRVYTRTCPHELGDADTCRAIFTGNRTGGSGLTWNRDITVATITASRLEFTVTWDDSAGNDLTDYFKDGWVTWTSGNNNTEKSKVLAFTGAGAALFKLKLKTRLDIQVGDTGEAHVGCSKVRIGSLLGGQFGCVNFKNSGEASNIKNYGGFPFIPGVNKVIQTPNAK